MSPHVQLFFIVCIHKAHKVPEKFSETFWFPLRYLLNSLFTQYFIELYANSHIVLGLTNLNHSPCFAI